MYLPSNTLSNTNKESRQYLFPALGHFFQKASRHSGSLFGPVTQKQRVLSQKQWFQQPARRQISPNSYLPFLKTCLINNTFTNSRPSTFKTRILERNEQVLGKTGLQILSEVCKRRRDGFQRTPLLFLTFESTLRRYSF